ncbi:PREDICTED: uncharacterized protein LOC108374167 [Rhagoletis zephyria]|uniref:uncharacterized protein LOC108374167 n=1 Tax=Rhagoletis zephyria TaxID=28612 RepID=UPI0008116682|nr:PREDICTED: uncharacterized protein LOC108374167 [Rhagoletis zephyria]
MQQVNSLERAFTMLTYFLSAKDFYDIGNQKTCHELEADFDKVQKAVTLGKEFKETLYVVNDSLSRIENNIRTAEPQTFNLGQPYPCKDQTIGDLFCEDNRYSTNLLLIGRGAKALTHSSYQYLLVGNPCDARCITSDVDFFIGWNEFTKLYNKSLFGLLLVYIDASGMENFLYIPEIIVDDKKIKFSKTRSSMLMFNLEDLLVNKSLEGVNIRSWKMYLKRKDPAI